MQTISPYNLDPTHIANGIAVDSLGQLRIDTTSYSLASETMLTWDSVSKVVGHQSISGGVTPSNTVTLTNKRITSRVNSNASSSTPTPSADNDDIYLLTALAVNATFGAPTGTPTDGQVITIRIKDNGTSRTLAWNAIYRFGDVAQVTATVISKTLYVQFMYNAADNKWDQLGAVNNF
jgi:hypothetical protein